MEVRFGLVDPPGRFDAVHDGHVEVHEQHVQVVLLGGLDGFRAVGCGGQDGHVLGEPEHDRERLADGCLVVDDDQGDRAPRPASTTSAPTSTTPASARNAPHATTSTNSKPSATRSPSNPPPDRGFPRPRLRDTMTPSQVVPFARPRLHFRISSVVAHTSPLFVSR
jgi:hypothetical protein